MVVLVTTFDLSIPGCASLKEKRRVVRSLKDRIRNKFNVSIAETDHQDVWTRAELTLALVSSDGRRADSIMSKVEELVESDGRALIRGRIRSRH